MKRLVCVPLLLSLILPLSAANATSAAAERKPSLRTSVTEGEVGTKIVLKGKVWARPHTRVKLQKRMSDGWTIVDRARTGGKKRFRFRPVLEEGSNRYRVVSAGLRSKPVSIRGRKKVTPPPTCETDPTLCTPPTSGWPDGTNTGVPAGTVLAAYTGPCTITSARTISAVDVKAKCNALVIQAKGVIVERSLLPRVDSTYQDGGSSVTVTDSTVQAGNTSIGAVWGYNINATRLNVTGGQHSFHCNNNCVVTDSWLHDQYNPDGGSYHNNAFISNGGSNMTVRHNTLHCTAILNSTDGGCTADLSLFGDFDPIDNVLVENNLFKANNNSISYCAYGGDERSKPYQATNVRFVNNVFERGANRKCGVYGPVTSFNANAAGNAWSGNVWEDGAVLTP